MDANFNKRFLTNTDETGRFLVTSQRTGRTYYVEPIGDPHTKFGSIDPATKKLVHKDGWQKYRGSIDEPDSLITKDNGFSKIRYLEPGVSPHLAIDQIDSQYPDKQ